MCDSWTATSEGVGGWGVGGRSRGGGKTSASTTKCFKDEAGWVEGQEVTRISGQVSSRNCCTFSMLSGESVMEGRTTDAGVLERVGRSVGVEEIVGLRLGG